MKEIIMYTADTCSYCKAAKEYFEENDIPYVEKNTSQDPESRKFLMQNRIMGVPAIYIDGELLLGFDRKKIEKKLSE